MFKFQLFAFVFNEKIVINEFVVKSQWQKQLQSQFRGKSPLPPQKQNQNLVCLAQRIRTTKVCTCLTNATLVSCQHITYLCTNRVRFSTSTACTALFLFVQNRKNREPHLTGTWVVRSGPTKTTHHHKERRPSSTCPSPDKFTSQRNTHLNWHPRSPAKVCSRHRWKTSHVHWCELLITLNTLQGRARARRGEQGALPRLPVPPNRPNRAPS